MSPSHITGLAALLGKTMSFNLDVVDIVQKKNILEDKMRFCKKTFD